SSEVRGSRWNLPPLSIPVAHLRTRPPLGAVHHLRWTEALPKRPPSGGSSTNGSVACPRKASRAPGRACEGGGHRRDGPDGRNPCAQDRKSTRLNSSHEW